MSRNEAEKPSGQGKSTLPPPTLKSGADWLASENPGTVDAFLEGLSDHAVRALPYLFDFWALEHQVPPGGDWRTWVIMGGRGAGKTRAGAEWVRAQVEGARPRDPGVAKRVALVGETYDQVREVMIFGESGIMACSPPDRVPVWRATQRKLIWPNGAEAQCFSAADPEALRGPQFDAAWADELAKWKRAEATWDMLQFCLRIGEHPRAVVTTTPRNVEVLKALLKRSSTVQTHAKTQDNAAYLAKSFLRDIQERYGDTRLGRQELQGLLLEDVEGALWHARSLEAMRVDAPGPMTRIVVAVDPPVTGHAGSDACGIVVVGVDMDGPPRDWRAYVLEDASVSAASPNEWARAAINAALKWKAHRIVAEVNQGGDLVESLLRTIDPMMSFKAVRASVGKVARAEPVAALYEQGRVRHLPGMGDLEDQMCRMSVQGYQGRGSPDRVDALVWALTETMLEQARDWQEPQVRSL